MLTDVFMAALGHGWRHQQQGDVVRVWHGYGDNYDTMTRGTWFLVSLEAFVTLPPVVILGMADEINAARERGLRGQVEIEVFRHHKTGAYKFAVSVVAVG